MHDVWSVFLIGQADRVHAACDLAAKSFSFTSSYCTSKFASSLINWYSTRQDFFLPLSHRSELRRGGKRGKQRDGEVACCPIFNRVCTASSLDLQSRTCDLFCVIFRRRAARIYAGFPSNTNTASLTVPLEFVLLLTIRNRSRAVE